MIVNSSDEVYGPVSSGTFIDSDGDEHEGMPGVVAHDCPWAEIAVEVEGGYMVFDNKSEYEAWKNQK